MIKKIEFTTKGGVHFDFEFRGYINQVLGESGSGKSFFVKEVLLRKEGDIENKEFWDDVLVFIRNRRNLEGIKNQKNKVILIDNADILETKKYIDYIRNDRNNVYVIFSRGLDFSITPNYIAQVINCNNVLTLEYMFSERLWFDGNSIKK
jgi:hypothetical protein